MAQQYIYCLKDPNTQAIRYVGKSFNPELRLLHHIYSNPSRRFKEWIKTLNGSKPIIEILETCEEVFATKKEAEYIYELAKSNDLVNVTWANKKMDANWGPISVSEKKNKYGLDRLDINEYKIIGLNTRPAYQALFANTKYWNLKGEKKFRAFVKDKHLCVARIK